VLADFGFVVGPVLAVSIALTVSPEASVLTCAALLTIAVPLVLRGAGRQRPDVIVVGRHWSGPLRSSAVRWVFGVATFFFIGVHVMEVVLVSYGGSQKVTLTGGALLSVIAIASMVGGTVLGGLPEGAARRFMRPAMVMSGIAAFLLLLVGATFVHPVLVFAACVPVGLCLGPSFAAVYGAAGDNAPEGQETETQSWVAGAMMLGGGIGTAAGGWSIQHAGLSGALLIAPVGCAIAALCATRLPRAGG
jgi:MFS family permease